MNLAAPAIRPSRSARSVLPAAAKERWLYQRVGITWGLMVLNAATFYPSLSGLHVPSIVGKAITQGALPLALVFAISINRKLLIRPNIFLCLVGILVCDTIFTLMQSQPFGTYYRVVRFIEFYAVLWLLTPWWGRRDMLLLRCHLRAYYVLLGSAVIGVFIFPGKALGGRLTGALWPIPPPQVAHYSAMVTGLVVILWLGGVMPGRQALRITAVTMVMLILTHTRTALLAMIVGIVIAGLSLVTFKPRVRRFFATAGIIVGVTVLTASSFLVSWLARGQGASELENLTGRTKVWGPLLAFPRDRIQEIFGFGLSNSSFAGLPIDSSWLSSYLEEGLLGAVTCGVILFFLLVTAYFQIRGVHRALALFIIVYCLIASFTEDGFADASTYLLEMTLAASLIVPSLVPSGGTARGKPESALLRSELHQVG